LGVAVRGFAEDEVEGWGEHGYGWRGGLCLCLWKDLYTYIARASLRRVVWWFYCCLCAGEGEYNVLYMY
jgi:hypothetical protein